METYEVRPGMMQRRALYEHSVCETGACYDGSDMYCYVDESYVFRLERR